MKKNWRIWARKPIIAGLLAVGAVIYRVAIAKGPLDQALYDAFNAAFWSLTGMLVEESWRS